MALLHSKLQVHKPGHGCTSIFGSINRCRASLCTQRTPQHPAGIAHGTFGSLQLANAPVRLQQVAAVVASQSGTPPPPRAAKKKAKKLVDINGDVSKDLGNGMFQIKLENGVTVMAHLSGKIRQNRIKIVTGDKVTVELSPYDLTKGRLTYRFKPGEYERLQQAAAAGAESASQSK